jgi:DeoR/GlpR family transcriptional regulator of sugar metabolism
LQRVHGGGLPASIAKADFAERKKHEPAAKAAIAEVAARLIRNGQVIIMDGGTTNIQVAQHLPPDIHATIVTNSPPLATVLAEHPHIDVVMLGGNLYKHSVVTMGTTTLEALQMVRADLFLLGICGLHPEIGISSNNLEEAHLKRAMMKYAAEVVALASPDKLNTASPYIIAPITELNEIITDHTVSNEILEPYQVLGITVTRA